MTHAVEAVGRDDRVGLGQGREGGCGCGGGVGEAQRWRGFGGRLGQRDVGHQVELQEANREENCKRLLCRLIGDEHGRLLFTKTCSSSLALHTLLSLATVSLVETAEVGGGGAWL